MKKSYQVIFVDEYDNMIELGIYGSLKDAEQDVNEQLKGYTLAEDDEMDPGATPAFGENGNQGPLEEYASTLGPAFDRMIPVTEGCVQVRGFVRYDVLGTISANKLIAQIKDYRKKGYEDDDLSIEEERKGNHSLAGMFANSAQFCFGAADALEEILHDMGIEVPEE